MKIKNIINKIGLFSLPVAGGILGALGGSDNSSKLYRRFVIPALLTSFAYSNSDSVFVITIMFMSFALSLGYGIPDVGYPENTTVDSGSAIGRFFYFLFKKNLSLANIFTRGTIALLISLSLVSVVIIKKNFLIFGLCSLGIILTNGLISWRGFGVYKLFKKELSVVETINWGLITLFATILIYF